MKHLNFILPLSFAAVGVLAGCATSLANRSPIDIASNSVRRTDVTSGTSEIAAPQVDVLNVRRRDIVGKARLRTAGAFTDDKGRVLNDGVYMDIVLSYSTTTPYPEETRFYDQLNWSDGVPALLAEYGASVVDCREDVQTIRYEDPYRQRGYGYEYYGRSGKNNRDHKRDHKDHKNDEHHDNEHSDTTPPQGRPDLAGHKKRPRYPHKPQRVYENTDPAPARAPKTGTPPAQGRKHNPVSTHNTPTLGSKPVIRPDLPVREIRSRPLPATQPVRLPNRPKPTQKPSKSKPASQSKPNIDRVFNRTDNDHTRTPHFDEPSRRYDPGSFYSPVYEEYIIRTRCKRVENIRIFVPRERLEGAGHDGLILYVRPRFGPAETIVLPENYIEGFKLAAYSPEGETLTRTGAPIRFSEEAPTTAPAQDDPRQPIIYEGP